MFSKPIIPLGYDPPNNPTNKFIKEVKPPQNSFILSYNEYFKKNINLAKYKIPELKQISRTNKLQLSGSKKDLIDRILVFFEQSLKIEQIQKIYRGHIVRKSFSMRGEGFTNRNICVNDSDFYTLEPLREIPSNYFFSFTSDNGKFVFGCNIISLMHLIKTKSVVKNPYNREQLPNDTVKHIIVLYNLINIIFKLPEDAPVINTSLLMKNYRTENITIEEPMMRYNRNAIAVDGRSDIPEEIIEDRRRRLLVIQSKSMATRIQQLFIDIDLLGNYTNYLWFMNLDRREYIRLYRVLYDIWIYRGHLSREMKRKICVLEDPFSNINAERIYLHDAPLEIIQEMCLKIYEKMVYCGIDEDHRKIGALHALSALTIISVSARNSIPWLYDSLVYM